MVSTPNSPVYTDFSGLAQLRAGAKQNPETSLREVARQFEAVYLQMILKGMRESSMGDPLFDGPGSDLYREMFDNQLSLQMTQGKGLGLADMLVQQLRRQQGPVLSQTGRQDLAAPMTQSFLSHDDFIKELKPYAEQAAQQLGTTAEVLLAQAALETGWGQHIQHSKDGTNSYNVFNIKADASWRGARVVSQTQEYVAGKSKSEQAAFRVYQNYAEAFDDYVKFIQTNPRYRQALNPENSPQDYIQHIHAAGYATDPAYAKKWNQLAMQPFVSKE